MTIYNEHKTWKGDYINKSPSQLGQTTHLQTGGAGLYTDTILGIGDKYLIDIRGSMMTWKTEDTPLLSILYNMGTESAPPPYITWTDEYTGDAWFDIGLDDLRLVNNARSSSGSVTLPGSGYGATISNKNIPVGVTESTYVGGMYEFYDVDRTSFEDTSGQAGGSAAATKLAISDAVPPTIGTAAVAGADPKAAKNISRKTNIEFASGDERVCFPISVKASTNHRGRLSTVYDRLRQFLYNFKYSHSIVAASGNNSAYELLLYTPGETLAPIYFAFDTTATAEGDTNATKKELHEVLIRIEAVKFIYAVNSDPDMMIIFLNPAQSNIAGLSSANLLLLGVSSEDNQATATHPLEGYIAYPSRMCQVGQVVEAPLPIPEGDNFSDVGNFTQHRETLVNYSQIFATGKYGITGTVQASKFRFGNDFAKTREMWMKQFKSSRVAALLRGVRSETKVVSNSRSKEGLNGQPVRSLGGLLDYSLFPITYIRKPLATLTSVSTNKALDLSRWLSDLGNSLTAFRSKSDSSRNLTLLCSQKFLDKLDLYVRSTFNDPWMGGQIQIQKPSALTFGLEIYQFKTSRGIGLNFIHEPALDYMVEFPVAYHMFGKGKVDAKDILLSLDTNNIKHVICRPDVIHGGIQDPGQDMFQEAMRGEASFMLRFPKNHAIIYVPES